MKSDADRSFQMMTCPAETANLTSWPLVSASASSFRNDCAGSLNYASKCLTDRYQHLIVNCCVFSNQFSNNIKCAILLKTYHTKQVPILKSSSLTDSHISDRSLLSLGVLKQSLLRSLFTVSRIHNMALLDQTIHR